MKNTGVVRRLDELGRITLPMELRKVFGIEERDSLEIYVEDDKIILKKFSFEAASSGFLLIKPKTLSHTFL